MNLEGEANTCVLAKSTAYRDFVNVTMQIGYLAGSPGYSIDPRPDYAILGVSLGELRPDGTKADVLEDRTILVVVQQRRDEASPDAGAAPFRRLRVRMASDPDPAKWTLSLYAFE